MTMLKRAEKQARRFLNPIPTRVGGIGMMWKILPMYLTNREERVPRTPPGPFQTDPAVYAVPPESGLRVTWMGHSSTLLEIDGVRVLLDPMWDERASPSRWFGPKRFFAPPLRLENLPRIDAIVISHDHYDHLGRMTVERLALLDAASEARWVTSLGVGKSLRRFGVAAERITELDWTESVSIGDMHLTALPSRHFSGRSLFNRFGTLWSSFALKGTRHNVYYGADSGLWPGFTEIGSAYGPFDLTLLEIGASNQLWSDVHLGPDGAAQAFLELGGELGGTGMLMPVHWGLFDLALHGWRKPIERLTELADSNGITLWSPHPGEPTEVVSGVGLRSPWWHAVERATHRQVADSSTVRA